MDNVSNFALKRSWLKHWETIVIDLHSSLFEITSQIYVIIYTHTLLVNACFRYNLNRSAEGKVGLGIIIVNKTFGKHKRKTRNGAEKDKEHFEEIFDHLSIDYEERSYFNCTAGEMWKNLENFAVLCGENNPSVVMVAIATHGGDQGDISGTDSVIISLRHIFNFFERSGLSNIPKVFLIQACRGPQSEDGLVESMDYQMPSNIRETSNIATSMSNTLIAYSTCEGYKSYRDGTIGAWFVKFLWFCVHHEPYQEMHFVDLLTICSELVIRKDYREEKEKKACRRYTTQTVCYQSTLKKFLFFHK